jgi:glycosyltransferase involved in cell wall biosynthesis
MNQLSQYLEKKLAEGKMLKKAELVIVNDGSKDKTFDLILDYTNKHQTDKNLIVRGVNQVQN